MGIRFLDEDVDFLNNLRKIFNLIDNKHEDFLLKISNELIQKFKYWYLFFKISYQNPPRYKGIWTRCNY